MCTYMCGRSVMPFRLYWAWPRACYRFFLRYILSHLSLSRLVSVFDRFKWCLVYRAAQLINLAHTKIWYETQNLEFKSNKIKSVAAHISSKNRRNDECGAHAQHGGACVCGAALPLFPHVYIVFILIWLLPPPPLLLLFLIRQIDTLVDWQQQQQQQRRHRILIVYRNLEAISIRFRCLIFESEICYSTAVDCGERRTREFKSQHVICIFGCAQQTIFSLLFCVCVLILCEYVGLSAERVNACVRARFSLF